MPRIDDTLDAVGGVKYLSKVDLLKGFYQVSLSKRTREVSAFMTPNSLSGEWTASRESIHG